MIGDSETDIATAKAASVPVVAVDFGYSLEPVRTFAPDAVISHFDELRPRDRSLGARQGETGLKTCTAVDQYVSTLASPVITSSMKCAAPTMPVHSGIRLPYACRRDRAPASSSRT